MRVCGLKLRGLLPHHRVRPVAPHAGVWIETPDPGRIPLYLSRTPCGCVD